MLDNVSFIWETIMIFPNYHRSAECIQIFASPCCPAYFCQPTSSNCFPARVVSINKSHLKFLMNVSVGRCDRVKYKRKIAWSRESPSHKLKTENSRRPLKNKEAFSLVTALVYLNRTWTCSRERRRCENFNPFRGSVVFVITKFEYFVTSCHAWWIGFIFFPQWYELTL